MIRSRRYAERFPALRRDEAFGTVEEVMWARDETPGSMLCASESEAHRATTHRHSHRGAKYRAT